MAWAVGHIKITVSRSKGKCSTFDKEGRMGHSAKRVWGDTDLMNSVVMVLLQDKLNSCKMCKVI